LDNVVYRIGFSPARQQARQWILHGHFTVDGKKVNIPSYRLKPGQVIKWKPGSENAEFGQVALSSVGQRPIPAWLELDKSNMSATVVRLPEEDDLEPFINTRLVVEHYSR
jgi:small subunit ribosomal protein S4